MWLPNAIITDVEDTVTVFYVNYQTTRIWAENRPSPAMRAKLARVLGLTEAQLTLPLERPREVALGPAQRAVVLAQSSPQAAASPLTLTEPVRDVFSITGRSDGQISVRLQATLDAQKGMALARFLMDFGLIIGDEPPNAP